MRNLPLPVATPLSLSAREALSLSVGNDLLFGLSRIYRFEIEKFEFVPHTYSVDVETFTDLGMLYAKIKLGNDGQYLHLFNNHLQSSTNYKDNSVLMQSIQCRKD